jgi:hypothetical protein
MQLNDKVALQSAFKATGSQPPLPFGNAELLAGMFI